ncbi:unnamed protein product [Amoebophrya sp. A120]|nr:unnamed protein product [Amoebophrya sp. A120]|eukprot:GSA120T00011241001.1
MAVLNLEASSCSASWRSRGRSFTLLLASCAVTYASGSSSPLGGPPLADGADGEEPQGVLEDHAHQARKRNNNARFWEQLREGGIFFDFETMYSRKGSERKDTPLTHIAAFLLDRNTQIRSPKAKEDAGLLQLPTAGFRRGAEAAGWDGEELPDTYRRENWQREFDVIVSLPHVRKRVSFNAAVDGGPFEKCIFLGRKNWAGKPGDDPNLWSSRELVPREGLQSVPAGPNDKFLFLPQAPARLRTDFGRESAEVNVYNEWCGAVLYNGLQAMVQKYTDQRRRDILTTLDEISVKMVEGEAGGAAGAAGAGSEAAGGALAGAGPEPDGGAVAAAGAAGGAAAAAAPAAPPAAGAKEQPKEFLYEITVTYSERYAPGETAEPGVLTGQDDEQSIVGRTLDWQFARLAEQEHDDPANIFTAPGEQHEQRWPVPAEQRKAFHELLDDYLNGNNRFVKYMRRWAAERGEGRGRSPEIVEDLVSDDRGWWWVEAEAEAEPAAAAAAAPGGAVGAGGAAGASGAPPAGAPAGGVVADIHFVATPPRKRRRREIRGPANTGGAAAPHQSDRTEALWLNAGPDETPTPGRGRTTPRDVRASRTRPGSRPAPDEERRLDPRKMRLKAARRVQQAKTKEALREEFKFLNTDVQRSVHSWKNVWGIRKGAAPGEYASEDALRAEITERLIRSHVAWHGGYAHDLPAPAGGGAAAAAPGGAAVHLAAAAGAPPPPGAAAAAGVVDVDPAAGIKIKPPQRAFVPVNAAGVPSGPELRVYDLAELARYQDEFRNVFKYEPAIPEEHAAKYMAAWLVHVKEFEFEPMQTERTGTAGRDVKKLNIFAHNGDSFDYPILCQIFRKHVAHLFLNISGGASTSTGGAANYHTNLLASICERHDGAKEGPTGGVAADGTIPSPASGDGDVEVFSALPPIVPTTLRLPIGGFNSSPLFVVGYSSKKPPSSRGLTTPQRVDLPSDKPGGTRGNRRELHLLLQENDSSTTAGRAAPIGAASSSSSGELVAGRPSVRPPRTFEFMLLDTLKAIKAALGAGLFEHAPGNDEYLRTGLRSKDRIPISGAVVTALTQVFLQLMYSVSRLQDPDTPNVLSKADAKLYAKWKAIGKAAGVGGHGLTVQHAHNVFHPAVVPGNGSSAVLTAAELGRLKSYFQYDPAGADAKMLLNTNDAVRDFETLLLKIQDREPEIGKVIKKLLPPQKIDQATGEPEAERHKMKFLPATKEEYYDQSQAFKTLVATAAKGEKTPQEELQERLKKAQPGAKAKPKAKAAAEKKEKNVYASLYRGLTTVVSASAKNDDLDWSEGTLCQNYDIQFMFPGQHTAFADSVALAQVFYQLLIKKRAPAVPRRYLNWGEAHGPLLAKREIDVVPRADGELLTAAERVLEHERLETVARKKTDEQKLWRDKPRRTGK